MTQTRAQLMTDLASRLGSATEARWIVDEVLGVRGARSDPVPETDARVVANLVTRRMSGEPLQYVLGSWPFRSLELFVDRRALVPRPETELVVGYALDEVRRTAARGSYGDLVVADLGTGTGAIALSLAVEFDVENLQVWATDSSAEALALAAKNRDRVARTCPHAAARVHFARGDWYDALPEPGSLCLVVSNPPYVAVEEWAGLAREIHHEPYGAVISATGSDGTPGFAGVEAVVEGGARWLAPQGSLVVEITPSLSGEAVSLASRLGFVDVRVERDLCGRERVLVAKRPALR